MQICEAMQTCEATLEERIGSAADVSPYLAGSNISLEPVSRRVVVRGVVNSYYEKQMAQETLLRVDGVESVENHLEVLHRRCR
ncbi:MAG TPA: BON domain-containing protein [Pirellulaceae bacterium]|nr:BON domain-containing protein [Pirellulaceae bacterium]